MERGNKNERGGTKELKNTEEEWKEKENNKK